MEPLFPSEPALDINSSSYGVTRLVFHLDCKLYRHVSTIPRVLLLWNAMLTVVSGFVNCQGFRYSLMELMHPLVTTHAEVIIFCFAEVSSYKYELLGDLALLCFKLLSI